MYVFISENCRKEAKIFGLEAKIDKIARQIERLDYHEFTTQVDKFEHPFYVKKQVAYNYRLLVKVVDLDIDDKHHQVAVFFKIFNRSNKGYDDFYYHVEKQGNMLYNQQDIDKKLTWHLKNLPHKRDLKNTKVMNQDDSVGYFFQVRTDILQLVSLGNYAQYYEESRDWFCDVGVNLSDEESSQVFEMIQAGMENNSNQQCRIAHHEVVFHIGDNPKLTVSTEKTPHFSRLLPQECILDKASWLHSQNIQLPIYLNAFQKHIIEQLFHVNASFPLIVQSPNNHGKTSLSAILTIHFLSQPNWKNHGVLPCLFLCNPKNKASIREQLINHVRYYQKYINPSLAISCDELEMLIEECCHDMTSYLQNYVDDDWHERCHQDKMIDFDRFVDLWQSSSLFAKNQYHHYPVSMIWYVIYHLIKGKNGDIDITKDLKNHNISHEDYLMIYQNIYKGWYELLQKHGFWDLQDLVAYAHQKSDGLTYASLIVDDAQEYTKMDMAFLLKQCYWYHKEGLINQAPLLFFGNHHGMGHYFYDWHQSLKALLHEMLDDFNEVSLLQPTVIDYSADFLNALHFLLHIKRQLLKIVPPSALGSQQTQIHTQQVYFIDADDTQMLHALFGNKSIPIVVRETSQRAEQYLMQDEAVGRLFLHMKPSEGDVHFMALDDLSQKHQHVALAGFFDEELSCFFESDTQIASLELTTRLKIDELLKDIYGALNHALSDVFIIGKKHEYDVWQKIFSHQERQFICMADIGDINQHYLAQHEKYHRYETDLNKEQLIEKAEWLFDHAYYEECMKTLMFVAYVNKNYEHYFDFTHGEGQKAFTLSCFWKYQNRQALSSYVKYFKDSLPKAFVGNCYLIQLLDDDKELLPVPKIEAFNIIFNKYLSQYKDGDWREFWAVLLDELMDRLPEFNLSEKEIQCLGEHLKKLVQKITPRIYHYLASYHHCIHQDKVAFTYWQTSKTHQELAEMPIAYYQLATRHGDDWQEKLMGYVYLDNLGAVMNLLSTQNLNELQASYWDKILPYLEDIQELKPVILSLLPDIHNPDVLKRIHDYCQNDLEVFDEEFENRLQRLLTIHACLVGDWQTVIERIRHYKPVDMSTALDKLSQSFAIQKTTTRVLNKKGVTAVHKTSHSLPSFEKPQNELVDIIYALSLNEQLVKELRLEDVGSVYGEDITAVFDGIREIFTKELEDECYWNVDFPAVRALACLVEKSQNPKDIFEFYRSMLFGNKHHQEFALTRFAMFWEKLASYATHHKDEEPCGDFLQKIEGFAQQYQSLWAKMDITETPLEPLKTKEEVVKSALALTDRENKEIQRLKKMEQDHQKEQARLEKERLEKERLEAERLEAERLEMERQKQLEKERLEQERQEQERLEQERLEQERREREKLEQERLEKERLEKERLEQERLEKERQEQEQLEMERLEQEKTRLEEERLAQERLAQSACEQAQQDASSERVASSSANKAQASPDRFATQYRPQTTQAVSSFEFFGWRVFVARLHGRVNIEDLATGERFSVQVHDGLIQSDWHCEQDGNSYRFMGVPLLVEVVANMVFISHLEHGISLTIKV